MALEFLDLGYGLQKVILGEDTPLSPELEQLVQDIIAQLNRGIIRAQSE
jgi:hypothetical protein